MSATAQYVVAGIFAGFAVAAGIALVVLFRRVAVLERARSANPDDIEPGDEDKDEPVEVYDGSEDDRPFEHFSQVKFRTPVRSTRQDGRRPAAASSVAEEAQVPLEVVAFVDATAAYNDLVADFGQAELHAFEQRWHPQSAARTGEHGLADDPKGDFWIIRTGDAAKPYGLVVPGPEVMRNWELYYRSMGSMAAKNLLEGFYELGDGVPLRLKRPAIATQTDRGWRVEAPGLFAEG